MLVLIWLWHLVTVFLDGAKLRPQLVFMARGVRGSSVWESTIETLTD